MKTVAELYREGKIIRRYELKLDEKGYYWDGMTCASWRRKTRKAAEAYAARFHYDVCDTEEN